MNVITPPPTRLLSQRDIHGAPLADFDWYESLDLLHVCWHGHLTADSLVQGAEVGLTLPAFTRRALPTRLLTNHQQASGDWEEALPWLQYDWLPRAQQRGLRKIAHLISHDAGNRFGNHPDYPDRDEFLTALRSVMLVKSFRNLPPAWYWLIHH